MEVNYCPFCMEEMGQNRVCPHCHKDSMAEKNLPFALQYNTILHGKYLIGAVLGQGGFGITYIGFDLSLEIKVAIKEYYPKNIAFRDNNAVYFHSISQEDKNQWAVGKEQFLSEARKMAKVNDIQSIVSVRETFYENDTAYIVMDYVSGITLKQFIERNGTLTFKECTQMMLPIIDGLAIAHTAGMIHRDISPDNVMVSPNGKMYLLDMGAAKDLRKRDEKDVHVVKMGYSPLEQFQGTDEIGPWSDIYALCATIYNAVLGRNVPNALDRRAREQLTFEGGRKPLTKAQIEVLEKGLALHRESRIQSAAELAKMLRNCVGKKSLPFVNKKLVGLTAGAVASVTLVIGILVAAPWKPKVEKTGCPNTNLFQESDYQQIENQYDYFIDCEWNLSVVTYDEEDKCFYINSGVVVDDEAGSVNLGKNKVYFIHDQHEEEGNHDSILQMDFDGNNVETVLETDGLLCMQSVTLTNGKEFLYYITQETEQDDSFDLYRYNLDSKKTKLVKKDICWFNMDGKYLYYTTTKGQSVLDYCALHRCFLDGSRDKILDDKNTLDWGYVVDGNIYMRNLNQQVMVKVDESKKNKFEIIGGDHSTDIASGTSVYGDGWFYYCPGDSTEIHRVMSDGTGDDVIATMGKNIMRMNYVTPWIYALEGDYDSDENQFSYTSSSLIYCDGSTSMSLGTSNDNDVTYKVVDGEAFITGYTGTEGHVSVPTTINGYPLNTSNEYMDDDAKNVTYHMEIPQEELSYENVDGGICITGFNPVTTKNVDNLAIPEQIDGKPVIEIGESAFSNKEKSESEQYNFVEMLLPDTIQIINTSAFYGCSSLEYVNMPSDLKHLNKESFAYCPLTDLEIVLPEGIETIGAMAFANAAFKSIYLPDSLEIAGDSSFVGCGQNSEDAGDVFLVDQDSKKFCVENGILYNADKTVIYSVQAYKKGILTIPDSVTEIRVVAFARTDYDMVTIPNSVTEYTRAFCVSDVKMVSLEDGIKEIPEAAFYGCDELTDISIPDSVVKIDTGAFAECESLEQVTINSDCTVAGDAFESSTLVTKR